MKQAKGKWRPCPSAANLISTLCSKSKKSCLLGHIIYIYTHTPNWQTEGKRRTYLTLPRLSERMPFQIMLQIGVLNAVINLSSIGLRSGLMRGKPRSMTPAPKSTSAKPSYIIILQVNIHIKHELISKLVTPSSSSLLSPRELWRTSSQTSC